MTCIDLTKFLHKQPFTSRTQAYDELMNAVIKKVIPLREKQANLLPVNYQIALDITAFKSSISDEELRDCLI